MRFPTLQYIVSLNRTLVEKYGGKFQPPDNLINPNSLHWVLEAIQYPIFNSDNYPTIHHKAALLMWIIYTGHVFNDGNKRTGFVASATFLDMNGYKIIASSNEVKKISLAVATHSKSGIKINDLVEWFAKFSIKK